jgi:hypothetical protein
MGKILVMGKTTYCPLSTFWTLIDDFMSILRSSFFNKLVFANNDKPFIVFPLLSNKVLDLIKLKSW